MFSYVYIFMTIQWVYDFGQTHVFLEPICVNKVSFQYLVKLVGTIPKESIQRSTGIYAQYYVTQI